MLPIPYTLSTSLETARTVGAIFAIVATCYIVWDAWRLHGRAKIASSLVQAIAFLLVALTVLVFVATPEHLPDPLDIPLRSYGLFMAIGMLACLAVLRVLGARIGMSGEQALGLWLYGGLAAMVGGRALYVLVNLDQFASSPLRVFAVWDGGLVFIGSIVAALAFATLYLRRVGIGRGAYH